VDEDEPLFMSLIDDMFPGIKLTIQTYKELQKAIANATEELGIMNHSEWNLKTVQARVSNVDTFISMLVQPITLLLKIMFVVVRNIAGSSWYHDPRTNGIR
jgi:hypothetical protein